MHCILPLLLATAALAAPPLLPVVEAEGQIYVPGNPNNGAGPLWCYGSTVLARLGDNVFASGMEVLPDQKPLNNTRWTLFQLIDGEWKLIQADPTGRQREPCPLGVFADGRLLLTSNPTLTEPGTYNGAAQPQVLVFDTAHPAAPPQTMLPVWQDPPTFSEHSYRGFCVDGPNHEALYFNNLGYDSIYWSFLDRDGKWSAQGKLSVPFGAEFEKPEFIRVCYHNMALRNRAAHTMGVSDIIEPVREWREYKLILHNGQQWDYDFRRLYYCYTPDITKEAWKPWILVADCDKTCGHITNLDLWIDAQGRAHLLWLESSVWDTRVRDQFFPDALATQSLMYAVVENGQVGRKVCLQKGGEKQETREVPGYAHFQATPDGRLFVFYYVSGADAQGRGLAENRLLEMYPDGTFSAPVRVALQHPFNSFMTAGERGGSAPSATLDVIGQANEMNGIAYARINLLNQVLAQFDATITRTADGSEVALDASGSRSAEGRIASYAWQIGEQKATGETVRQRVAHGGQVPVSLTVSDGQGHTNVSRRTLHLPPAPDDFGLRQWGLVERIEAEGFAREGGGVIHVRTDKLNASGLSLSHYDTTGHWLEWEFDVPADDRYYLAARYAVPTGSARALAVDGKDVGELAFPATGGYGSEVADDWALTSLQAASKPAALTLTTGKHTLRLTNTNGLGVNLDYLELLAATLAMQTPVGFRGVEQDGYRFALPLQGTLAPTQIRPELGFCYNFTLGPQWPGDGIKDGPPSTLHLFEDGKELGPAHFLHADIRTKGEGRFSHWVTMLYFSASDNSDPRVNGRRYEWRVER
ncbi:MAG: carbohydrate-binding protein [Armatimonadetes bacterium]|nr:carbohydrate-binding protein [Armatimonadota bacterium]